MKIRFKTIGIVAGTILSLSLFAGCGVKPQNEELYDSGVVKAFYAVTPGGELVSQTAVSEGQEYLVTVITSSSVSEYRVDSGFRISETNTVVADAAATLAAEEAPLSDLEQAYEKALALSGIDKAEVDGFDFDRDTYMGRPVFKVEIEDSAAEYSYTFAADDFSLLASKTELKTPAQQGGSSYIGEAKAKSIALNAVGIDESKAEGFTLKNLPKSGRRIYEANFLYDGYEYTVEIDAVSGEIVKFSKSVPDGSASYPEIPSIISEEAAKSYALAFVFPDGTGADEARFRKIKLDYENGKFIYEIELEANGNEYELELSAYDGAILDAEIDRENRSEDFPQSGVYLTREEAVAKVLEQAGADAFVLEVDIEKEYKNGVKSYFYEIEVRVNGRELEYYVDAITGAVTLNEGYAGNPADPTPTVSEAEALQFAIEEFGLKDVTLDGQKIKLEREDGILCYEIKLYVGRTEYKALVDAHSGAILEREIDFEHETELPPQTPESAYITREQAIEAVKAYFSEKGKTARVDSDVEWEDEGIGANKRYYYEVEAYVDGREYECYVDAVTGTVRVKGELIGSGKDLIGEEAALGIALDYYSLTKTEVRVIKVKLEEDDGILIYEVEFKVRDLEYTFEIDAETGAILDIDRSFD